MINVHKKVGLNDSGRPREEQTAEFKAGRVTYPEGGSVVYSLCDESYNLPNWLRLPKRTKRFDQIETFKIRTVVGLLHASPFRQKGPTHRMSDRPLASRLWYEFLRGCVSLVGPLAYGLRHSGRENIPPSGPVLVVSNHQSHFDPPLVGAGCPRRLNYLARDTLFGFKPFRWLINSLDAIPIDRDGLGLNGIKESLRRMKRGEMVLIFPEGTRTRDGSVGTFRPGFTVLAARAKAWILPVAIEGCMPPGRDRRSCPVSARSMSTMASRSRRKKSSPRTKGSLWLRSSGGCERVTRFLGKVWLGQGASRTGFVPA